MKLSLHETALRLLARRAYSQRELAERLIRRQFARAAVEEEVARLVAAGLLDDRELAQAICRAALQRGKGPRALAGELQRRRIDPAAAAEVLAGFSHEEEAQALAVAAARAFARHPRWQELPRERAKVIRYLLTRGFAAAAVQQVVGRTSNGENDEEIIDPADS